jgi:DUF438 domain-containing protein
MTAISLDTGLLTPEQVDLLLKRLPADITYVDEHDEVRYYSGGDRIFTRMPVVIGHKVQQCHPPASIAKVQEIIDAFRAGRKDEAEFWLKTQKRFVHIRYIAMRDGDGRYRGTLEVVQDATVVRDFKVGKRLLEKRA